MIRAGGLLACSVLVTPLAGQARDITRVSWLQGCWLLDSPQRSVEENWTAPRGRSMLGVSRTIRGDSLTTYELVIIRQRRDSTLEYEAHPAGQPTATFPAIIVSDTLVVFENPTHDFPQRVGYRRAGRDSVIGYIEGVIGGQTRRRDFPYARARCADRAARVADSASVTAFYREWFGSMRQSADAYAGFYAADGLVLPPGKPPAIGRAAIAAWLTESQASAPYTVRPEGITVDEMRFLTPDLVVYRSTLRGQRIPKAGGDPTAFETKYVDLLRRTDAGRWEVLQRMWSDNR